MAIHKRLDMYTRITQFRCDTCSKYIEENERNFFSKTTRDTTETLCPACYARAKTFQLVTGAFSIIVIGILFSAALVSLFT